MRGYLLETRMVSFKGLFIYITFPVLSLRHGHIVKQTTGFFHKCESLDICFCEFEEIDRQRNKIKYSCLQPYITPLVCPPQK